MSKHSNSRKRLTAGLALLCCLSILVGSFAFFTDRHSSSASATVGFIDLTWEDTSLAANSNNEFAIDSVWENESLVADGAIINPGDYFDMSYTLTNTGSKSIDVRQQLTLTSSVPLTEGAEEYKLTITGGNDSTVVTGKLSDDKLSIVYDLTDITLNGSVETEDNATDGVYAIRLDFLRSAGNSFMNSTVAVNYKAMAKQHRNTNDADWVTWVEYETKFEQVGTSMQRQAKFIAHQGYAAMYPRNTLLAVEGAKKYGFDYVEVDLCTTADNHFVVMHDRTVDAMTDGTGTIGEMTLSEIKELNIDNFSTTYSQETISDLKVPTLEEFFDLCNKLDIVPIVELKDCSTSQLDLFMDIVNDYDLLDTLIVESFDERIMDSLRSLSSELQLAPLVTFSKENVDYCKSLGRAVINVYYVEVTTELMDYAKSQGVPVMVWTVNLIENARTLEEMGVKYIMSEKLLYRNSFDDFHVSYSSSIPDNLDGTTDAWGNLLYLTNNGSAEHYKDLVHFTAEVFYSDDVPTVAIGNMKYVLDDKPNEWQTVDFVAPANYYFTYISMKDKTGSACFRNASIEILSPNE